MRALSKPTERDVNMYSCKLVAQLFYFKDYFNKGFLVVLNIRQELRQ